MIVTDHEGKTSGSVLHGLVYAPGCALDKGIDNRARQLSTPEAR
jgi:hypothetical protein